LFDRKVGLTDEDMKSAIGPFENVKHRSVLGGPAFDEVKRMIADRTQQNGKIRNDWESKKRLQQDKIAKSKELAKES
jgi:hypothetical protein